MANIVKQKVFERLYRLANPHLSRFIGAQQPPFHDWRLDPNPVTLPKSYIPVPDKDLGKPRDVKPFDHRRPFRILCLDGGGVRGALTNIILLRLHRHNPRFLQEVDLICGTSAGGMVALMLAAGYSPDDVNELYSWTAPYIFAQDPLRLLNPFEAKYSDKTKQEILQYYLGDRRMGDLEKNCAVIAFRLDGRKSLTHSFFNKEGWRPAIFSNMPKVEGRVEPDLNLRAWDAAMRTSAAPTYFPVFRGYTDGGVVANNPSILACANAMVHFPHVHTKNIALLSLGAGIFPRHTNVLSSLSNAADLPIHVEGQIEHGRSPLHHADWGIRQWIPFMLDLLLDGDSVTTEMVMEYLLQGTNMYHRLDPRLPKPFPLDDVGRLKEIQDFAWTIDLTKTINFLDNHFLCEFTSEDNNFASNALDHAAPYHDAWLNSVHA